MGTPMNTLLDAPMDVFRDVSKDVSKDVPGATLVYMPIRFNPVSPWNSGAHEGLVSALLGGAESLRGTAGMARLSTGWRGRAARHPKQETGLLWQARGQRVERGFHRGVSAWPRQMGMRFWSRVSAILMTRPFL
jgi:hypothetical protein